MINDVARHVIERFDVDLFVETGLYEGETIGVVRGWFPDLPILSLEIDVERIVAAEARWPDVVYVPGSSELNLQKLTKFGLFWHRLPFFYLDAHWNEYCPLLDELRAILKLRRAIVAIDDFDVPRQPESNPYCFFGEGRMWTLDKDLLRELVGHVTGRVYYPKQLNAHQRGMCIVFLGIDAMAKLDGLPIISEEL